MIKITIIAGSTRKDRQSINAANYLYNRLKDDFNNISPEVIDLREVNLPMFDSRIELMDDPEKGISEFSEQIKSSDSLIIVSPEYNGAYPAVLKNALDHVLVEVKRKPIGIVTVSGGGFGGISCLTQLRLVLLHMGAIPIPASLPFSFIGKVFDEAGSLVDKSYNKKSNRFFDTLFWLTEAVVNKNKAV